MDMRAKKDIWFQVGNRSGVIRAGKVVRVVSPDPDEAGEVVVEYEDRLIFAQLTDLEIVNRLTGRAKGRTPMSQRIKIVEVWAAEGPLYSVWGEGEMLACYNTSIMARDASGREWVHYASIPGHYQGEEFNMPNGGARAEAARRVALVRKVGSIDPMHWTIYDPEPGETLEERWQPFGYEYRLEREEAGLPV